MAESSDRVGTPGEAARLPGTVADAVADAVVIEVP
jgi:hypothetical protein